MEALLDSGATGLVISSEFARKQGFKLKKIGAFIYTMNVNRIFNKKRLIENTMKINQRHKERIEIDIISRQK